jgi:Plasmid pRiA4b ORF-3-like protein
MSARLAKRVETYQIKVTLHGSQLPIWRRIQVGSDTTLAKLHRILQRVMGWQDSHLHQFTVQGERYSVPSEENEGPRKPKDERKHKLSDLNLSEGSEFQYTYDFGDNWEHVLAVEKAFSPDKDARYPVCLAGARACPPEDVGGIPGYEGFLRAISHPKHPEHQEYLEWIGGSFDSEAFDVEAVNQSLQGTR